MTEDVRELVRAIRSTIGSDSTMAQIARISAGLEEMTREATALIAEHHATIGRTVDDLGSAAASLRQTIDENSGRVAETLARMDSASVRLSIFAARLDTLVVEAHAVIDDLQHGEGTLPRLLHDDQLLQRWEATALELDALVADIRKNPGKYLKLKLSLF